MGNLGSKGVFKKTNRFWGLVFGLFLCSYSAIAAVQPADKAVLNQTQVMFTWDEYAGADSYLFYFKANDALGRVVSVRSLAYLVKGLRFGQAYQWQYVALKNGKALYRSPLFSFSIASSFLVDDNLFRYNIRLKQAGAYADNLIFLDHLGVAVNRQGQPVWYLPFDSMAFGVVPKYRNLQITPNGSFTFLKGSECWEKDRQGQILWTAPNDGRVSQAATEFYHHDFTKNADGSYMVCSYQFVEMPNLQNPAVTSRVRYNTVIQYDAAGKVIWQWNEKDHSDPATIFEGSAPGETEVAGTHMNGFACNTKAGVCIFSFRNNSTLLVIDKATGKVIHTLQGEKPQDGIAFAAQHSPAFLPNGDVMVYNNNVPNNPEAAKAAKVTFPTILQLHFDKDYKTAKKVWEYECRLADYPQGWAGKEGYADMLPNGNVLIGIGGGNKIIEVGRDKKTVWEMDMLAYDDKKKTWMPFSNYRNHFTSSLYPHFFTVQQISGTGPVKMGQSIRIKINNDGTDAGMYKIELFSSDVFAPYSQTFRLLPGASIQQTITLKKGTTIPKTGEIHFAIVRITPLDNREGVRNLEYRLIN